jgi:predicted RNase H-like HicB family nuclease
MIRNFTLEYWLDDGWYVGRLREVPGVFSQGQTLAEVEENIRDAYQLMMEESPKIEMRELQTKEIGVDVLRKAILNFGLTRYRSGPAVSRVEIDVMTAAVAL